MRSLNPRGLVLISQYYRPEIGAPQNRLFEMVVGLKKHGWDISIITAMPNYPGGRIHAAYRAKLTMREILDGIPVKRFWMLASNSKKAIPRILSMLSFSFMVLFSVGPLRRSRCRYLLIESPPLTLGLSGYFLSRMCGAKLILNISDLWPLTAREMGAISDGFLYRRLCALERFLYDKAQLCLGQSQEIVDYLDSHGSSNSYLFRNGVDPGRFTVAEKSGPASAPSIIYTGLLGIAQGIVDICKAVNFKELGVRFHIYGDGPEKQELEAFLEKHSERGIVYHGSVSREQIPDIVVQHDATLIPLNRSIYGAVPSKIYESMAAGLPILYSGEGEARSIILEHNLGWVSPAKDYAALASNIASFGSEKSEWIEKRSNCLSAADGLFNRPVQIGRLHEYLKSDS